MARGIGRPAVIVPRPCVALAGGRPETAASGEDGGFSTGKNHTLDLTLHGDPGTGTFRFVCEVMNAGNNQKWSRK